MKRNHFLDVLKGICILLVILTHFDWTEEQTLRFLFPFWVNPAVPIFMIISGFLYTASFEIKEISNLKSAYNSRKILQKIYRFLIPFLLIYGIELLLKVFVLKEKLMVFETLFQLLLGGYGPGSYYFQYMIQFVFVFPLIYFAIKKWDIRGLLGCGLANILYEIIKSLFRMPEDVYRLIVLRYIFAIALGCFFSIGKFCIKKWIGILSSILGATFIFLYSYVAYKPLLFYWWTKTSMMAVLYVAPIAYILIKRCTWKCKILETIGQASYNIFLVQMVFFYMAKELYSGIKGEVLPMIITYISCICLGILFYKVEVPITRNVLRLNAKILK